MIRFGNNTYIKIFCKCGLLFNTVVYTKLTYHPYNLKFTCFQLVNFVLKTIVKNVDDCYVFIQLTLSES